MVWMCCHSTNRHYLMANEFFQSQKKGAMLAINNF
jgi:hypothetical protein